MMTLSLSIAIGSTAIAHAEDAAAVPAATKRPGAKKRARRATHEVPPQVEPSTRALPRSAGAVPPGAQLGPDRVIEAPQAPGPDSSPPRETVPASAIPPKRERHERESRPPYPTGYDPGRNMQPTQGFSPSGQSVVP